MALTRFTDYSTNIKPISDWNVYPEVVILYITSSQKLRTFRNWVEDIEKWAEFNGIKAEYLGRWMEEYDDGSFYVVWSIANEKHRMFFKLVWE